MTTIKSSFSQENQFTSLLIANRGEIACRIIKTAKRMGLRTIAVYSEADQESPHVHYADHAYQIGPAPVKDSYLLISKIIEAAKATGAEAIHPGYGFLSENPDFATACKNAGIVFIGPSPHAIEVMGDKAKSKRLMIEAGVPCVPGYQGEDQSEEILISQGQKIKAPVMVKAAAGGGGRGMRLVEDLEDLPNALKLARSEAITAFGSGELILEKAILNPRHVEIQIIADHYGNYIHLGERDCSVQRRHQKIIEESPCPLMTDTLRSKMGSVAINAAKAVDYHGAGTVEFLLDQNGDFYFLEMNTRLQVEHPVTEQVTGLDLVELQISTAFGQALAISQGDITLSGHAIEARLYAEDPGQEFLPATGPVDCWEPFSSENIRVDDGIKTGGEISPFYDPMVAKIIAHGKTREEARLHLIKALEKSALFGFENNKTFLIQTLQHQDFINGKATTSLILYKITHEDARSKSFKIPSSLLGWSSASILKTPFCFSHHNELIELEIYQSTPTQYEVTCDENFWTLHLLEYQAPHVKFALNGKRQQITFHIPVREAKNQTIQLAFGAGDLSGQYELTNQNGIFLSAHETIGENSVTAPMHGQLTEIFVKTGDRVTKGQKLAILEAMKMQHELSAQINCTISEVFFNPGSQVPVDSVLMEIEN